MIPFSRIPGLMFGIFKKSRPSAPAEPSPAEADPTSADGASWRERLRDSGMARGLSSLFARNPRLDEALLDDIETALLLADVGVLATQSLIATLRDGLKSRAYADVAALRLTLRNQLLAMLAPVSKPLAIESSHRPFVILMVGINGAGKTTTIGKLAHRLKDDGRRVMLAAGDTFRAAAVEQLKVWGARNEIPVTAQTHGADPAAVIYDAMQAAKARDIDVLIADTAGRLHTQAGLMAELGKVRRVIGKLDDSAPHEVLMVIDGTTGQNAVSQLRQFQQAIGVTGLVISKLDGSAKGGVVFALAREFGLPVRFIGLGERMEDLRPFDAESFVDSLLPETLGEV
ncbi:MAG: signal recognition particle-docking protein FtsY [Gammaproteobacteria bacterium HGW-Gammaproteobacteria-4]|jgi:fused signal recognition particle receptor|nr:MAG: signal recognition particle-docking protein FtsY [Gammaproteobacteria bacterium HGW-Gammaproteobacteria-4]